MATSIKVVFVGDDTAEMSQLGYRSSLVYSCTLGRVLAEVAFDLSSKSPSNE